jgi:hypothetical protein
LTQSQQRQVAMAVRFDLLFECSHVALVIASRSKHLALFDGVSGVREWMVAAYKLELAATLGSCMQDMMHDLKAGLDS